MAGIREFENNPAFVRSVIVVSNKQPGKRPREIVRVRRETQGRGGKTVTAILDVPLEPHGLAELASALKRRCGSGGTVKDGVIELQGDHRDTVIGELEERGYEVKRAGG